MQEFVTDMDILFGGSFDEIVKERIIQNIFTATNSLNSLSKLLQRVRVSHVLDVKINIRVYKELQNFREKILWYFWKITVKKILLGA